MIEPYGFSNLPLPTSMQVSEDFTLFVSN
jgi:hypothetical protein